MDTEKFIIILFLTSAARSTLILEKELQQCMQIVKKRTRALSKKAIESADNNIDVALPRKRRTKEDKLYETEVVAEDGPRVKVHYTGYDSKFDEWKSKEDIVLRQPETPQMCEFHPITELACQIKKKLLPSRHVDPDVRIQVPVTEEFFSALCCRGKPGKSKNSFGISSYADLTLQQ